MSQQLMNLSLDELKNILSKEKKKLEKIIKKWKKRLRLSKR